LLTAIALALLALAIKCEHLAQQPLPKVVALTFDDGPHPVYTPFLIGKRVEQFPEIARRIVAEGHEVGNHTYSHPANLPKENWEQVRQEIEKCSEAIERVTGVRPKLFRPPRGFLNY
jgi:peptidoglycan/xylan/chitin deacetylase (PgdA/CDA1 family)